MAFRTVVLALAGEGGKAPFFAFESDAFSLAFFACFGPIPSCFSVLDSLSRFPARVPQVSHAIGAQRTSHKARGVKKTVLVRLGR